MSQVQVQYDQLKARLPKAPTMEDMNALGGGFLLSYSFLGGINFIGMLVASWAFFLAQNEGRFPLTFEPLAIDPGFLALFTGIYVGYGSIASPFVLAGAVALTPKADAAISKVQEIFECERPMAIGVSAVSLSTSILLLLSVPFAYVYLTVA